MLCIEIKVAAGFLSDDEVAQVSAREVAAGVALTTFVNLGAKECALTLFNKLIRPSRVKAAW